MTLLEPYGPAISSVYVVAHICTFSLPVNHIPSHILMLLCDGFSECRQQTDDQVAPPPPTDDDLMSITKGALSLGEENDEARMAMVADKAVFSALSAYLGQHLPNPGQRISVTELRSELVGLAG